MTAMEEERRRALYADLAARGKLIFGEAERVEDVPFR